MWKNMEKAVRWGRNSPHGLLLDVVDGEIQRDQYGNALGGIRVPAMDVPIA